MWQLCTHTAYPDVYVTNVTGAFDLAGSRSELTGSALHKIHRVRPAMSHGIRMASIPRHCAMDVIRRTVERILCCRPMLLRSPSLKLVLLVLPVQLKLRNTREE